MSENSLFSLKNIGQTFEKSFFFSFFFGKKIIGKLMRHVFYNFFKKTKFFLSAIGHGSKKCSPLSILSFFRENYGFFFEIF
jgi:hypothetical protein